MITHPMPLSDPPDDGGYHAILDFHKLHLSRVCPKTPLPGGVPPSRTLPAWRYPVGSRVRDLAQDAV